MNHKSIFALAFASLWFAGSVWAADVNEKPNAQLPLVSIPVVACPMSTNGDGLLPAGKGGVAKIRLDKKIAKRVAYYGGVLAPRGWHCFLASGSNGSILFIAPQLMNDIPEGGFHGPAIQASVSDGGTSGRFEVAHVISRIFPKHMNFVQSMIDREGDLAKTWAIGPYVGPYPTDQLKYKSDEFVEYHTPPNTEGLGTMSRLWKNSDPIDGFEMLVPDEEMAVHAMAVRLSPDMRDLVPIIVNNYEAGIVKNMQK